ncbi:hypothetical protein [uncultured Methanospirillum sp.]|uniref:hypothetical protein n=1 Tax=uncultured Methanospirillum sp. TaxID=262503 RepID=UPI0029C6EADD|nr:hypothetical protein [uncultured Methanospirillum sp.]
MNSTDLRYKQDKPSFSRPDILPEPSPDFAPLISPDYVAYPDSSSELSPHQSALSEEFAITRSGNPSDRSNSPHDIPDGPLSSLPGSFGLVPLVTVCSNSFTRAGDMKVR